MVNGKALFSEKCRMSPGPAHQCVPGWRGSLGCTGCTLFWDQEMRQDKAGAGGQCHIHLRGSCLLLQHVMCPTWTHLLIS